MSAEVFTIESDEETSTNTKEVQINPEVKSNEDMVELEIHTPPANPFVEVQILPEVNSKNEVEMKPISQQGPAFEEFEDISVVDLDDLAQQMEQEKRRKVLMRNRVNIHIARALSWILLVVDLIFGSVGLALGIRGQSPILIAYAQLCAVDLFCSIVLIWRYWHGASWEEQNFVLGANREKRSSIAFSVLHAILGITVFVQSLLQLVSKNYGIIRGLIALSLTSTIVMLAVGVTRLLVGADLGSISLKKLCLTSFSLAVLSLAILVTSSLLPATTALWWLDGAIGIGIGVLFFVHGFKSLIFNRHWIKDEFKFKRCIDSPQQQQS